MSEFHVEVVEVGEIRKHENADTLGVTMVRGYPVIVRLGEFAPGQRAVYIPVDAVVPANDPRWAFLGDHRRIKAKRLRGTFSMGLLTAADPVWTVGQDVREQLRISQYEPPEPFHMGGDNEKDPGFLPVYTDIEGLRRFPDVLRPGEEVLVTEKILGANGRAVWWQDRLWVGSHTGIKRVDAKNMWWKAALQAGLVERLRTRPGVAIYFEVYGQVQDLTYGHSTKGKVSLALFDALTIEDRTYLGVADFLETARQLELPTVSIIHKGAWDPARVAEWAEGKSLVPGADNIREGFVVRPVTERWDSACGRVILKRIGEGYLLRGR